MQPGRKTEEEHISVKVKNAGNRAGKDVVQVYVQAPYTVGGVEKASVNLVGFAKTSLLAPGAEETVEVTLNLKDFTSYDVKANDGKGGYILDAGNYYIAAAGNAHEALNSILSYRQANGDATVQLDKMIEAEADSSKVADAKAMVGVHVQKEYDSTTYNVVSEGLDTIEISLDHAKPPIPFSISGSFPTEPFMVILPAPTAEQVISNLPSFTERSPEIPSEAREVSSIVRVYEPSGLQ